MYYPWIKRIFDSLAAASALVLLAPLLLIIAAAVKLDSRGPVLFRQSRVGLHGAPFTMYKFRSMVVGAEKMGTGLFNYEDDPRVTRVGRFLRSTSLDELPQLWNILKGDMSIVGPRPCVVGGTLGDYADWNAQYKKRVEVLPGVTGFAQINGRNDLSWEEKILFDNEYVDRLPREGIKLDLWILWKTVGVVFSRSSIYEKKPEGMDAGEAAVQAAQDAFASASKNEEEEETTYVR